MSEWHSAKYWRNRQPIERLKNAHIPKRFTKKTLDDYNAELGSPDVVTYVRQWLTNIEHNKECGEGLYFFGGSGSGKTHVACGLLREIVLNHQLSGFFITAEKFVEASYDEMNPDNVLSDMYSDEYMLKYINAVYDVLVLDNLGSERMTDFTKKAITSMLNSRYEQQLITIITSEIPLSRLSDIYGPRVASILSECCCVLPFLGKDYRLLDPHYAGE